MSRINRIRYFLITVILLVVLIFAWVKVGQFVEIDHCLDYGGKWNYETVKCEYGSTLKEHFDLQSI